MRIGQLSSAKRSEDFVESFKLLSILSCSRVEPQGRALNIDSDTYPLARDAYGIKDRPIPLFSPTAVTFHEPMLADTNNSITASDFSDLILNVTENSCPPVSSFPCRDDRSTERKRSAIEAPARPASESQVSTESIKKEFQCVDDKALGSSFAKCLDISDENEKNRRKKDEFARARDSRSMTADAVRKIGREYLRKHVRIWHDLSDVEDDDDGARCKTEHAAPKNFVAPSESTIPEEDEKAELVDGCTQTTDEIEVESPSKFVNCSTQTVAERDDESPELSDDASYCKISKCLRIAKRLPKPKAVTDEIARLTSQNSLDVLSRDVTEFS